METTADYIADLSHFITASPSSYHAAHEVGRRLSQVGFTQLSESDSWTDQPLCGYILRDGAIIAWVIPRQAGPTTPLRIIGVHTDSPGFMLKPQPTVRQYGWLQAAVEVYGGPLINSWLDRELELAGRIVTRDGIEHLVRTGPILRIPQLAIHLDREANAGLTLNRQRHTAPIYGVEHGGGSDLLKYLADCAGIAAEDIAGHNLITVDTALPQVFGLQQNFFASARLDNLASVYAGVRSLSTAASADLASDRILVLAAFDHEELGSESRSGANGPLLDDVVTRLTQNLGASRSDQRQVYAQSWCVSADAGHAIHPNYPEKHDPTHQPIAGGGPLLKINANQRYATDAHGAALWDRYSTLAQVPYQTFVSHNDVPCGSTIGPLTATRLGIRTVDVGVPLLSMHSARELAHTDDLRGLAKVLTAYFVQ